ncbi:hypothetical protein MMC31_002216, partial [Peltigera leucophlebia]|nr:hypothetical protein [Peltigera leucophlebia]
MSDLLGGKFFCVKASWAHIKRQHERHYTTKPNNANVKNVVKILAFSPEKSDTGAINLLFAATADPLQIPISNQKLQNAKIGNLDLLFLLGWSKSLTKLERNIFPASPPAKL